MIQITSETVAGDLWDIRGNFGRASGGVVCSGGCCTLSAGGCRVEDTRETDEYGVTLRRVRITNTSEKPLVFSGLTARFLFDGGEYEVYTQYNGWQNESEGAWQPLVTGVSAGVESVRACAGAAPVLALWNCQSGRGTVFHLLPRSAWLMSVKRVCAEGETSCVAAEAGVNPQGLAAGLQPGETLELPQIVYFEFQNRTDLDCWKLHHYWLTRYAPRRMPVLYNTWLCRFDKITFENVNNQVAAAAGLGAEYFVIDAGWFGHAGSWCDSRGDWLENTAGALGGRMGDIADNVRRNGMAFGFWLEIETAAKNAEILRTHPEYYLFSDGKYFFDFTCRAARAYLLETVSGLIGRYRAEFIKFDFNQDLYDDKDRSAFLGYLDGYFAFIRELRKRHPGLYLECCASGGMRTCLTFCEDFDSIWFSDDQSPYEGARICRDTLLRMPPQCIEKWAAVRTLSDELPFYAEKQEKLISADDAVWGKVAGVGESFLEGFLAGGPFGFSCDLNAVSAAQFGRLKQFVAAFKKDRAFWQQAVCRILASTESVIVFQYSDMALSQLRLVVLSGRVRQRGVHVCPAVDQGREYTVDGTARSGKDLAAAGLDIPLDGDFCGRFVTLTAAPEK